ncbi:MAG: carboxypeptidase [Clostridium sp.]|nr:carboxypeptidase [Clostridium sp.]
MEGNKTVQPRGTDEAKVIQVIRTKALRGSGTEDDMCREVLQYWDLNGKLLAEYDPFKEKKE